MKDSELMDIINMRLGRVKIMFIALITERNTYHKQRYSENIESILKTLIDIANEHSKLSDNDKNAQ